MEVTKSKFEIAAEHATAKIIPLLPQSGSPFPRIMVAYVFIPPQLAREWLDSCRHDSQRATSDNQVRYISKELAEGHWMMNGDTIVIDENENISNGRHRLTACVETGIGFWSLVVFGVPEQAIYTFDRNKPRSLADVLQIHYTGEIGYVTLSAAVINFVYLWNNGTYADAAKSSSGGRRSRLTKMSPGQLLTFLEENPGFLEFVQEKYNVLYTHGNRLISPRLSIGLSWIVTRQMGVETDFFEKLSSGIGVNENSVVGYMIRKLTIEKTRVDSSLTGTRLIAFIIAGLNKYLSGELIETHMRIPKNVPEIYVPNSEVR